MAQAGTGVLPGRGRLLVVALVVVVVALSLAAVRSTGALWSGSAATGATAVTTGQLKLVAGSGSASTYQFPALTGSGVLPGTQTQAPLTVTNAGSTPLRYRLTAAGPQVTSGPGVTVALSGVVGGTCAAGALSGTAAFPTTSTSAGGAAVAGVWRSLARGASEVLCIRSELQSVAAAGASTYFILFTFNTEQTRS
ncbi:hypothetical protein [Williamsia sterculiae]|uniref:SipW-cognate class signal peptide n=1 Tax=Williamsia sterculiae TaxID=1344003 RepID=A0A1N7HAP9_9NOCA|nr:hypothetical protein [Williamsia sterculiae]SIS21947.1 hypothetical protein SAMN05445060_3836 [Williamsia sterculiae]